MVYLLKIEADSMCILKEKDKIKNMRGSGNE